MSCNYAEGLSNYEDKGVLGAPEKFDTEDNVDIKINLLSEWISNAKHVVVHTGAGISTSAGIPDFRGPNGVWTLERKGVKPNINLSFDDAKPTITHMALKKLIDTEHVKFIVSQNIDGLHLKSGLSRNSIAELHGNMFTEKCNTCERQFIRRTATTSVGEKCLGVSCPGQKKTGRACRGKLHDTILDWEANLPAEDLDLAYYHSHMADLNICLGTTLQIVPSGNLPLHTKKYGGRVVIINLQPTKHDSKASLIINTYVDEALKKLMKKLSLEIPEYSKDIDPTKTENNSVLEWTLTQNIVKTTQKSFEQHRNKNKKRKNKTPQKLHKQIKNQKIDVKNEVKDEENIKNEIKDELIKNEDIKSEIKNEIKDELIKNEISNDDSSENLIIKD